MLVLDDDEAVGHTICFVGESIGLECRLFTRPDQFFAEVMQWQPTHIAIDLVMPAMDGVEVLRHLSEQGCRARIIITSGVGSRVLDAAKRSASESGLDVVGVVAKPFLVESFRTLLLQTPGVAVLAAPYQDAASKLAPAVYVPTEDDLRAAIEQRQFYLDYQPKIHCRTRELAGFEALLRWRHPHFGIIPPTRFIGMAEATGLIDPITEQVTEIGLSWLATYFFDSPLSLSINISSKNLHDADLVERMVASCQQARLPPSRVIVEVTESSAMDDPVAALSLLTRLRVQGFQLSIDDFGTGFSSMLQLVRLPFSEMKIDRSFVIASGVSDEARAVIRASVELGHSLNLQVTAEGVEDARALEYLSAIGCDLAQGYFIARPLPSSAVVEWTRAWNASTHAFGS